MTVSREGRKWRGTWTSAPPASWKPPVHPALAYSDLCSPPADAQLRLSCRGGEARPALPASQDPLSPNRIPPPTHTHPFTQKGHTSALGALDPPALFALLPLCVLWRLELGGHSREPPELSAGNSPPGHLRAAPLLGPETFRLPESHPSSSPHREGDRISAEPKCPGG